MDELGTVVLEVKDIDWEEAHTIPTFDDVKVEELTAESYIGDHDVGSTCSENIGEDKNINVIESVIIGPPDENVKEIIFSPIMKDSLKPDSLDMKEIMEFDSTGEKQMLTMDSNEMKQPLKLENRIKKRYSVPQKFNCDLCNLKFVSHCSLQIHIRRHMGYKPFACELCGQAYPTKTQLVRHMKNHTNKLEHFCGDCGKSSLDISTLKKHAKFKHGANEDTFNLYRIKEESSHEGEKVIFIKTYRNGETNIRRFRLIADGDSKKEQGYLNEEETKT